MDKKTKDKVLIDALGEMFQPKERNCMFCMETYVGVRMICGDYLCEKSWQYRLKEIELKRPPSTPKGSLFYMDMTYKE